MPTEDNKLNQQMQDAFLKMTPEERVNFIFAPENQKDQFDNFMESINDFRNMNNKSAEEILEALKRIADPIGTMQREANETGTQLNGIMANQLASQASYLQAIAKDAILNYERSLSSPSQVSGWVMPTDSEIEKEAAKYSAHLDRQADFENGAEWLRSLLTVK